MNQKLITVIPDNSWVRYDMEAGVARVFESQPGPDIRLSYTEDCTVEIFFHNEPGRPLHFEVRQRK